MKHFLTLLAVLACVAAARGYLLPSRGPDYVHLPVEQSALSASGRAVGHGLIQPVSVLQAAPVLHVPTSVSSQSHERTAYHAPSSRTTVTSSEQVVNHGGAAVYHAPVAYRPTPIVYHSPPLVAFRTPDAAVSHHSTTVHETLPVVGSLPLYALH